MSISRFDCLPAELIHQLLGYFSAHEIFYTFYNTTSYINAVLPTYSDYRLNLQSISRQQFDLVCQHIMPEQIVGLTISDDEETPGLIDLFLARFRIRQFSRLEGLKLVEIGPNYWEIIIVEMVQLKFLRSFCFILFTEQVRWISDMSKNCPEQFDRLLFDNCIPMLSQLYQLRLCRGDCLNFIQFPHLRHLALKRSTVDQMKQIALIAPKLQILETSISPSLFSTEFILPMPQLTCLILQIEGKDRSIKAFSTP
jgi:hypothetical protein